MTDRELMQQALRTHWDGCEEVHPECKKQQELVAHSVVAGVLFDFMGWLTSRNERLVLSSVDEASPAVRAIQDFAKMRSLSLDDAQVQEWQARLTTPPRREWVGLTDEEVQEIVWNQKPPVKTYCGGKPNYCTSEYYEGVMAERQRIVNLLMIQHEAANGAHNYWHVAAQLIQADVASDT